jgi:hypothetical protein
MKDLHFCPVGTISVFWYRVVIWKAFQCSEVCQKNGLPAAPTALTSNSFNRLSSKDIDDTWSWITQRLNAGANVTANRRESCGCLRMWRILRSKGDVKFDMFLFNDSQWSRRGKELDRWVNLSLALFAWCCWLFHLTMIVRSDQTRADRVLTLRFSSNSCAALMVTKLVWMHLHTKCRLLEKPKMENHLSGPFTREWY